MNVVKPILERPLTKSNPSVHGLDSLTGNCHFTIDNMHYVSADGQRKYEYGNTRELVIQDN